FLGIYDRSQLVMMATVLKRLGRKRAVVINGAGHMDEASLAGENHMALLEGGAIYEMKFTPESVGLTTYPLEEIVGGDSSKNAEILKNVLGGNATPAQRDTVLLNAGLGMYAAGAADSIEAGIGLARESIETGNELAKLRNMVKYSNERMITKGTILDEIIAQKKAELDSLPRGPLTADREPVSLAEKLKVSSTIALISEVKRASPSKGDINQGINPSEQAAKYTEGGADAVSVLTDQKFFSGTMSDLEQVKRTVDVPVLNKDFIIDTCQIDNAYRYGADVILLIVAALDDGAL